MKKVIAILVVLLVVGVLTVVLYATQEDEIPIKEYPHPPISMEGYTLPEEVELPDTWKKGRDPDSPCSFDDIPGVYIPIKVFTPEDAVLAVMSVRSYLGIGDDWPEFYCIGSLRVENTGSLPYGLKIHFYRRYKGVYVCDDYITVTADPETREVLSIAGRCTSGLDFDIPPEMSVKDARKKLRLAFGESIQYAQLEIYLSKFDDEGNVTDEWRPRLRWVFSTKLPEWRYKGAWITRTVDTVSGRVTILN